MNYILDLLAVLCLASICGNAFLFILLSKIKKKKPELTYDARALLADLASGPALIKVEYVDRGDVLLRSPRHFS